MTRDEFGQYWRPARDSYGEWKGHEHDNKHPSFDLATALGIDYPQLGHWEQIELTDELKNLLLGIAGPHRDTLLKIYRIRREYEQKCRTHLPQTQQDNSGAEGEAGVDPS